MCARRPRRELRRLEQITEAWPCAKELPHWRGRQLDPHDEITALDQALGRHARACAKRKTRRTSSSLSLPLAASSHDDTSTMH